MRLQGAASLLLVATSGCSAFGTSAGGRGGIVPSQTSSAIIAGPSSSAAAAFVPRQKLPISSSSLTTTPRGGGATSSTTSALSSSATASDSGTLPTTLEGIVTADNWSLLSERGRTALQNLVESDDGIGAQTHVYGDWPEAGTDDEGKIRLTEKVSSSVSVKEGYFGI